MKRSCLPRLNKIYLTTQHLARPGVFPLHVYLHYTNAILQLYLRIYLFTVFYHFCLNHCCVSFPNFYGVYRDYKNYWDTINSTEM